MKGSKGYWPTNLPSWSASWSWTGAKVLNENLTYKLIVEFVATWAKHGSLQVSLSIP